MLPSPTLPASWAAVLQNLRWVSTAPSFATFTALVTGLVANTGTGTVTGMLTSAGLAQSWSHDRAHAFFSRAAWSGDTLGMYLSRLIVRTLLPDEAALTVAIDDTLFKKRGKKVFGAGRQHDGASRSEKPVGYGVCFVVAGLIVELPFCSRPFCLPVTARLWRPKTDTSKVDIAAADQAVRRPALRATLKTVFTRRYECGSTGLQVVGSTGSLPGSSRLCGRPVIFRMLPGGFFRPWPASREALFLSMSSVSRRRFGGGFLRVRRRCSGRVWPADHPGRSTSPRSPRRTTAPPAGLSPISPSYPRVPRPRDLRGQRRDLLTGTGTERQLTPRRLHRSSKQRRACPLITLAHRETPRSPTESGWEPVPRPLAAIIYVSALRCVAA
ncbi:transposase [Streptomyces sp. NPDC002589]|uniref:transposase n=1 Tax=Streptomyces sp. NPDC002589 TaxID=3154420 RepID=UPI0033181F3B